MVVVGWNWCAAAIDCVTNRPPRQRYDHSAAAQASYDATYLKANDRCWSQREVAVDGGTFLTALKIPLEARGECHVCVFLEDSAGREFALGSCDIYISAPKLASLPVQASLDDRGSGDGPPGRVSDLKR